MFAIIAGNIEVKLYSIFDCKYMLSAEVHKAVSRRTNDIDHPGLVRTIEFITCHE